MPKKHPSPAGVETVEQLPAPDLAEALRKVQARLVAMEHRAAAAEAETQRDIADSQRLEERHQQEPPPRAWCVESAQDEKRLAVLLNTLAQAGWTVDRIFEPRGGAYGVVAWREVERQNDAE